MSYYLLKPCRSTAAFISTLKKRTRLDLEEAHRKLLTAGYRISDIKVMLVIEGDPELTLYESGKILIKTDDDKVARGAVDGVYQALGLALPATRSPH